MGEGSLPVCVDPAPQAVIVCVGCARPIRERYLLRVHGGVWHERCTRCCECGERLEKSCFSRDNKLYCRTDYQRLFLVHCRACAEVISPAELVMRAGASVFHLHCFCCSVCCCRLQTGERCVLLGDTLLCTRDYHLSMGSSSTSDSGRSEDEDDEDEDSSLKTAEERNSAGDGELKRPKRPRTILTTQQRRAFKASFEVSSKPCRKVRETLAAETGLSVRVVQVWFQNQRAKMKKLARRKQQQQQCQSPQEQRDPQTLPTAPSCGLPVEMNGLDLYVSVTQQQQQSVSLEAHSFKLDPFRQGLTPPQMPGDHMNPYGCEAFFSDMDSDPVCHLREGLLSEETSFLTPIDRLYSMHDSYFAS
ncbi:LIM homeobox transcription factor 1-alpha [Hoplias malabaricus]|uniref:LIM homeobox transcription factor 1-alpha n=1 Tax=Hoplias malabaricus TaxID=27720 RepID=UPI003461E0AE